mmetsp:Transcript_2455/g.5206  ORF Transcript_2455/g.5206 Transcript_2455/m.5206 type:complete len:335 (+) Transcript_2455:169-1173(+)|eukprot:scaffold3498_cov176-Amphora_coffeaeformis.AAC.14
MPNGETKPLLQHHQSLTAAYEDYEHSDHALRTGIKHVVIYYTLTLIAFSFVVEKWPIVDSLYYASVLFTTIGYGDLSPTDDFGRIATMLLAIYGITILGIFLGIYGGYIVEANEAALKERQKKLNDKIIADAKGNTEAADAAMEAQKEPSVFEEVYHAIAWQIPIIVCVFVGGLVIGYFEGWGVIESLYWTVITSTTVGFGDDSPQSLHVRLVSIFFCPFAVGVMGSFLGNIAGVYLDRKHRHAEEKFLSHSLTLADINTMDADSDGQVDKAEFLSYMLVTLQRVDKEEIDNLLKLFDQLDVDKSGTLSADDLKYETGKKLRKLTATPPSGAMV